MLNQKVVSEFGDTLLNTVCSLRGVAVVWAVTSVLVACGGSSTKSTSSTTGSSQAVASQVTQSSSSSDFLRFHNSSTGASFSADSGVSVEVETLDDDSVQNIALYLDGQFVRNESIAPYQWMNANSYFRESDLAAFSGLAPGDYQLRAVATDLNGATSEASMTVTVAGSEPAVSSFTASITSSGNENGVNASLGSIASAPASVYASKTQGVAPLAVHFDSGAEGQAFHDRIYEWDFGDSGSGSWATSGLPKNEDTGPISAHVYNQPGTYTATLTVSDSAGVIDSLTQQITIVVSDANQVYAGDNTICISKSGNFSGCPFGAQQRTYSDSQFSSNFYNLLNGYRVLLRRGDSWNVTPLQNKLYTNVYLSAYGSCANADDRGICSNAPKLLNSRTDGIALFRIAFDSRDIVIDGIHATGATWQHSSFLNYKPGTTNLLINKVKVTVVNGIYGTDGNYAGIVDSDITGGASGLVYMSGFNMFFQGNEIHDSLSAHLLRLMGANRTVVTHNMLHSTEVAPVRASRGSHLLKLHGIHADASAISLYNDTYNVRGYPRLDTDYVYIANNLFGKGGDYAVAILPTNSTWNESLKNILFEKNKFDFTYGTSTAIGHGGKMLAVQAQDTTIRNNIIDLEAVGRITSNGNPSFPSAISVSYSNPSAGSGAPSPNSVKVYNNTINVPAGVSYENSEKFIYIGPNARNTEVINNLVVRPSNGGSNAVINDGVGSVIQNNLYTDNPLFVDGDNDVVANRDYRLLPSSPAIGSGISLPGVLDDYDGESRSLGSNEVGAYIR